MSSRVTSSDDAIARVEPPLLIGLEVRDLSRSATELLGVQRRAIASAVDPQLARAAVRAAHRELASSALADWLLDLDDERVRLHRRSGDHQNDLAREVAGRVAGSLADLARAAAVLPWRLDVAAAYERAAEALGARFDARALELCFTRSGVRIESRIRFREGAPATLVRMAFVAGDAAGGEPSEIELDRRVAVLAELGADVSVVGDDSVEVRRAGIIASADALVEVIDATLGLAQELMSEVRAARGPNR
jgi:hypothetical protein